MIYLFQKDSKLSAHKAANKRMFWFVLIILGLLTIGALELLPTNMLSIMQPVNSTIMYFCLVMIVVCIIGLFDKTKVPGEREFSNFSYFNILFCLGMGVGLVTYGFTEVNFLATYPEVRNPYSLVLHHWTLVPWCLYSAFTIFEIYQAKYNFLPNWLVKIKDYLYATLMMIGIGISFVLGVTTLSNGIEYLFGVKIPSILLVVVLASLVTTSLLLGLHRGIKNFSNVCNILFLIFSVIVIASVPLESYKLIPSIFSSYFTDFFYNHLPHSGAVQSDWTVYYWIWWLSWVPFVSGFIPTVSKGRSIRSVVAYTVLFPVILSTIFMTAASLVGVNEVALGANPGEAHYSFLSSFKYVVPVLFVVIMAGFYITSSDSQSFAMDRVISKGSKMPIVLRKIIWVLLEVLFVCILLYSNNESLYGLQGLGFIGVIPLMILAVIMIGYIIKIKITEFKTNKKLNHEKNSCNNNIVDTCD